jgi:hypothetical protein
MRVLPASSLASRHAWLRLGTKHEQEEPATGDSRIPIGLLRVAVGKLSPTGRAGSHHPGSG